jgi:hypothetical protein
MSSPTLYYEGTEAELEKKFNYHWQGGTWTEFKALLKLASIGVLKPTAIRRKFYTMAGDTRREMSREAYFRWRRTVKHLHDTVKVKEGQNEPK